VRAGHPLPSAVDELLTSLAPDIVVAADGDARLVVAPVGAFVLAPTPARGPALDAGARQVHELASGTRAALCRHLSWVPFLDALLVSSSPLVRRTDITVAPLDLLCDVLTEGPDVIDPTTVDDIRDAISAHRLGAWRPLTEPTVELDDDNAGTTRIGRLSRAGRIDLCQDTKTPPVASRR
jgi:hypothetical protein